MISLPWIVWGGVRIFAPDYFAEQSDLSKEKRNKNEFKLSDLIDSGEGLSSYIDDRVPFRGGFISIYQTYDGKTEKVYQDVMRSVISFFSGKGPERKEVGKLDSMFGGDSSGDGSSDNEPTQEITEGKNLCLISAESIAIEAALHDGEGSIIAVEYSARDRRTLEENVNQFGVNNVTIIDHVDEETMKGLPVPETTMLVASASMEQEIACMLKLNPKMEFVIYTLDFNLAGRMMQICREMSLKDTDITQITVSKMNAKGAFDIQPAPWLITCHGE